MMSPNSKELRHGHGYERYRPQYLYHIRTIYRDEIGDFQKPGFSKKNSVIFSTCKFERLLRLKVYIIIYMCM